VLTDELAVHLQNARQLLLERRRVLRVPGGAPSDERGDRAHTGGRRRDRARVGPRRKLRRSDAHGAGYGGAQAPAPRIVPVHLAQIAREPRADVLEHRQRFLTIAPSEQRLPAGFLDIGASLERTPDPLLLPGLARGADGGVEAGARARFVASDLGDTRAGEQRESAVCRRFSELFAREREPLPERFQVGRRAARSNQDAFEPGFCGVDAVSERVEGLGAGVVVRGGALVLPLPRQELGLEPGELSLHHRRELRALQVERVDAGARPREATEVEIRVGEVQQRLQRGRATPRAPAHVDRSFVEVDGAGDVTPNLE
jgi:hypothetical protein